MISALFVANGGCYFGLDGVDPWDEQRDARKYAGPWPVVAHPPCGRWINLGKLNFSRYGGEHNRPGNDGGCFAAALHAVRQWGGVLEHPANSGAWSAFNLPVPPSDGGWVRGFCGGWCAHVEQGHYGHRARKATWLYAFGSDLPSLTWGRSSAQVWCTPGASQEAARGRWHTTMSKRERQATPVPFRDLLIRIARSASERVEK